MTKQKELAPPRKLNKRSFEGSPLTGNLMELTFALIDMEQTDAKMAPKKQDPEKLALSFKCLNSCEKAVNGFKLYCSEYCQQVCGTTRYVRKAIAENRIRKDTIQGIEMRLLPLTARGYPVGRRKLSDEQRRTIFERDENKCQICGGRGVAIDHIAGDSSEPSNLQVICYECNRQKALKNVRPATPEELKIINQMLTDMAVRIAAPVPLYLSDDYKAWDSSWRQMSSMRRKHLNKKAA